MVLRFLTDALREETQHLRQHAQLYEAGGEREIEPAPDEHDNEYIGPEDIVYGIDAGIE